MKTTLLKNIVLIKKIIVSAAIICGSSAWAQAPLNLSAFSGEYTHPATSGHPTEELVVLENQGTLIGSGTFTDYGTDSHTVFKIAHVNEAALRWHQVGTWGVHYAIETQTSYNPDIKLITGIRSEQKLALSFIPSTMNLSVYQFSLDGSGRILTIDHFSNQKLNDTIQYFRK